MKKFWPHLLGASLGLAVATYAAVYLPMKENYERGGCVWLECDATRDNPHE